MRPSATRWTIVIPILLLTACSQQVSRPNVVGNDPLPGSWPTHLAQMQALRNWRIVGKIGYRSPADAGSAWLDWQQDHARFQLYLNGPLGTGSARIFGDDTFATLQEAGRPDIDAESATALTKKLLGWDLPVIQLAFWVRGIPAPDRAFGAARFSADGLLESFHQARWRVQLSKYRDTPAGKLPGKLIARHDDLRFTLLVKQLELAKVPLDL